MNRNDRPDLPWRKSSYSDGQANCVEVAAVGGGRPLVAVRDSKSQDGPSLTFTPDAWQRFTERVTAGHLGHAGGNDVTVRSRLPCPGRGLWARSSIRA